MPTNGERGSVVVSVALVAIALMLLAALLGGLQLVLARTQLARLAESSALAASDARRGLTAGFSCEIAALVAESDGAQLRSCRIVRDGVIVTLAREHLLFEFESVAYAGAP